jgi:hypothetical protein
MMCGKGRASGELARKPSRGRKAEKTQCGMLCLGWDSMGAPRQGQLWSLCGISRRVGPGSDPASAGSVNALCCMTLLWALLIVMDWFLKRQEVGHQWLMLVILATQEAEINNGIKLDLNNKINPRKYSNIWRLNNTLLKNQ